MRKQSKFIRRSRVAGRGVERLEERTVLSAAPVLTVLGDQVALEGGLLSLADLGQFTDVIEGEPGGGGGSVGIDPAAFSASSLGIFDPAANVVFDTDALTVTGLAGAGVTTSLDVGFGSYDVAVFVFDSFELDSGLTLSATGSRPLAILSLSDLTVGGTIDASARDLAEPRGFLGEEIAGPGGGNGGPGATTPALASGSAAYGAPADSVGNPVGANGGTGGAFGGAGGRAVFAGFGAGVAGDPYANLAAGIQGGSGGGTAGGGFFGGSGFLAGGGGGGGGIELGALGAISILSSGSVLANGGDGEIGIVISGVGGGGGGAGGGILLHGADVNQFGLLSAQGGKGGQAPRTGGGGGGGAIYVAYSGSLDETGGVYNVAGGAAGDFNAAEPGQAGVIDKVQVEPSEVPVFETYAYSINWGDSTIELGTASIDVAGLNIGDIVLGSLDGSHTYLDNGTYTVSVTVTGSAGGSDTKTLSVVVSNVAPTLAGLTTSSPAIGGAKQGETVTLSATVSDPGVLDGFTLSIDWGNGTVTSQPLAAGGGAVSASNVYAQGGVYEVTLTVTDKDGAAVSQTTTGVVAGAGVQDGVLRFVGTNADDTAQLYRLWNGDYKLIYQLGQDPLKSLVVGRNNLTSVEMLLGDGNDIGFVSTNINKDSKLDGGNGNDLLVGGTGDDILLGGAGSDLLFGMGGRDLLIGGTGRDYLFGDGGQDILIGGTTAYDQDAAALDSVLAEWTSGNSLSTRLQNLLTSGVGADSSGDAVVLEDGVTVFDDGVIDWLSGGLGIDLLFAAEEDCLIGSCWDVIAELEAAGA